MQIPSPLDLGIRMLAQQVLSGGTAQAVIVGRICKAYHRYLTNEPPYVFFASSTSINLSM